MARLLFSVLRLVGMAMAVSAVRVGNDGDMEMEKKAKPWPNVMAGMANMFGGGESAVIQKCAKFAAQYLQAGVSTFKSNVNTMEKLCAMYGGELGNIIGEKRGGQGLCEELKPGSEFSAKYEDDDEKTMRLLEQFNQALQKEVCQVSAVRVGNKGEDGNDDDMEMEKKAKPWPNIMDKMFGGGDSAVIKKCAKVAAKDFKARVSTFKANVNTIEKLCAMYGDNLFDLVGESSRGQGMCEELMPGSEFYAKYDGDQEGTERLLEQLNQELQKEVCQM